MTTFALVLLALAVALESAARLLSAYRQTDSKNKGNSKSDWGRETAKANQINTKLKNLLGPLDLD